VARKEHPFAKEPALSLINLILKSQGTNPLCYRLKKELQNSQKLGSNQEGSSTYNHKDSGQKGTSQEGSDVYSYKGTGQQGYTLDQQGLLYYKGRAVVPIQKTLI
jgi:hypothetical protein